MFFRRKRQLNSSQVVYFLVAWGIGSFNGSLHNYSGRSGKLSSCVGYAQAIYRNYWFLAIFCGVLHALSSSRPSVSWLHSVTNRNFLHFSLDKFETVPVNSIFFQQLFALLNSGLFFKPHLILFCFIDRWIFFHVGLSVAGGAGVASCLSHGRHCGPSSLSQFLLKVVIVIDLLDNSWQICCKPVSFLNFFEGKVNACLLSSYQEPVFKIFTIF